MSEQERQKIEREPRFCPYCDDEIAEAAFPYCGACGVTVFYCPSCRKAIPRDKKVCPECGAEVKGEKS